MRISHLCISSLLSWIVISWTTSIAIVVFSDINCISAFVIQGGSLSRTTTTTTSSFVVVSTQIRRQRPTPTVNNEKPTATQLHLVSLPDVSSTLFHATDLVLPPCDSSIVIMLADGEAATSGTTWKQYVALGVILGVIIDILLGSPLAGAIAAPLRQQVEQVTGESLMDGTTKKDLISNTNKKERVDSEAMAKDVLDKVKGQQELNDYLEKNKSPQQKMEELRRQLDQQFEN